MKRKVKPIPEGHPTVTPCLTVHDAAQVIEFYKEAFGAEERYRMPTPDGKLVAHAELKIGDSVFMLADEMPGQGCSAPPSFGGSPVNFYVYVKDVDAAFQRAVDAGATVKEPVKNAFWGDRMGQVIDPSGYLWMLATHVEDVSPEELRKRGQKEFEKMLQGAGRQ
jgi:PhnB protein